MKEYIVKIKKRYTAKITKTDGTPIINIFLAKLLRFINTPHLKNFKFNYHDIIQIIPMTANLYLSSIMNVACQMYCDGCLGTS